MVSITYTANYGYCEKQPRKRQTAPSSKPIAKTTPAAEAAHLDAALAALFAEDRFVF